MDALVLITSLFTGQIQSPTCVLLNGKAGIVIEILSVSILWFKRKPVSVSYQSLIWTACPHVLQCVSWEPLTQLQVTHLIIIFI